MPPLWEILGTDGDGAKKELLALWLIKEGLLPKNWRPPSSDGPIHVNAELEGLEEIAVIMEEKPKGKQAVLKG